MCRAQLPHSVERLVFSLLLTETLYSWSESPALFAHTLTLAVCRGVRVRLRGDAIVRRLVAINRRRPNRVRRGELMIVAVAKFHGGGL